MSHLHNKLVCHIHIVNYTFTSNDHTYIHKMIISLRHVHLFPSLLNEMYVTQQNTVLTCIQWQYIMIIQVLFT